MPTRKEVSREIIAPAGDLICYLVEEMKFFGVTQRSLHAFAGMETLIDIAQQYVNSVPGAEVKSLQLLKQQITESAEFATDEIGSDFSTLMRHSVIAMWSAVEYAVEEIVASMASLFPEKFAASLGKLPSAVPHDEEKIRRLARQLDNDLFKIENNPIRRQVLIFGKFDLNVKLSELDISLLTEINEARNVILHRGSIVDARFVKKCPDAGYNLGDRYAISSEKFSSFFGIMSAYAQSIVQACSDYLLSSEFKENE